MGPGLEELSERRRCSAGLERRSEPERLAAAEAVLGAWPVPLSHGGDRACYWPELDPIQLPERCTFDSAAASYATWADEGIHSTGHPRPLARDLGGGCGSASYAREELGAALGADPCRGTAALIPGSGALPGSAWWFSHRCYTQGPFSAVPCG